ncbi:MAG: putative metallopeptidase [Zavarzinella sp.]
MSGQKASEDRNWPTWADVPLLAIRQTGVRTQHQLFRSGKQPKILKESFDYSAWVRSLALICCTHVPALYHIDPTRIIFGITRTRQRTAHGIMARLIPLRGEEGSPYLWKKEQRYRYPTWEIGKVRILYLLEVYLPRFQNMPALQQLATVVHELYHVGPAFDGDFRRFGKKGHHAGNVDSFHQTMVQWAHQYLNDLPEISNDPHLNQDWKALIKEFPQVVGYHPGQPRLVPDTPPLE